MKIAANIAGVLLGLIFIAAGVMVLFKLGPTPPPPPEGSPAAQFFGAFGPTGYLTFVKVCEIVGGLLVAIPKTRNLGLLVLGPIIVNILAFQAFIVGGVMFTDPMTLGIIVLPAFLLVVERKAFVGLVTRR
jgi:putative oxidoreductase